MPLRKKGMVRRSQRINFGSAALEHVSEYEYCFSLDELTAYEIRIGSLVDCAGISH